MPLTAAMTIAGNLTSDPELRTSRHGKAIVGFTIAMTPQSYDTETKKYVDGETLFMRCSAFGDMANYIAHSLSKGDRVIAHGQVKSRSYDDREGNKRTVIEMAVDEAGASLKFTNAPPTRGGRHAQNSEKDNDGWAVVDDSDTPF